jgi:hypothetical protein
MKFSPTDYPSTATVERYRIDAERRMRIEEYQGRTGLADIRAILSAMSSDPCWSPDFHGLIDFSGAELDLSSNDVLRLALVLRHEENRTTGWLGFVATNSLAYGIVRMLGYWSKSTDRIRIFQSRAEAEAWLERNVDQVPPRFVASKGVDSAAAMRNAI